MRRRRGVRRVRSRGEGADLDQAVGEDAVSGPDAGAFGGFAATAATYPCGSDWPIVNSPPAGANCAPLNSASIQLMKCSGSIDKLATVSLRSRLPSR